MQPHTAPAARPALIHSLIVSLLATAALALLGVLAVRGVLPLTLDDDRPLGGWLRLWFQLTVVVGLVLPALALLLGWRRPAVRAALAPYLVTLLIQILTERVFSTLFFPLIVIPIGTLYTAYRLWQLWRAQRLVATTAIPPRWLRPLLWLLLAHWTINLVAVLLIGQWPRLL